MDLDLDLELGKVRLRWELEGCHIARHRREAGE